MLYIGLVVGAFLGICISIIVLGVGKDIVMRARSFEETDAASDQKTNETLPSMFSSFPSRENEEWLSDVSR